MNAARDREMSMCLSRTLAEALSYRALAEDLRSAA